MLAQIWVFQNTFGYKHFFFKLFYFQEKLPLNFFFELLLRFQVFIKVFIPSSLVLDLINEFLLFRKEHHLDILELVGASIRKLWDCTQMLTYHFIFM